MVSNWELGVFGAAVVGIVGVALMDDGSQPAVATASAGGGGGGLADFRAAVAAYRVDHPKATYKTAQKAVSRQWKKGT